MWNFGFLVSPRGGSARFPPVGIVAWIGVGHGVRGQFKQSGCSRGRCSADSFALSHRSTSPSFVTGSRLR
jgi:hypothetical protein